MHISYLIVITCNFNIDFAGEEISIPLVECVRILLGIGVFLLWCGLFGLLPRFDSVNVSW